MKTMKDQIEKSKVDISEYLGNWKNSYDKARVINSFSIAEENGEVKISVQGAVNGLHPGSWGKEDLKTYAYDPDMNDVVAFRAQFEMENLGAFLAINENKGLIIIAGFFSVKNDPSKSDFFVREFFYKV